MEETKLCTKCGRELPREMFSKCTNAKDGLQNHCKDCKRAYSSEYNKRKKTKHIEELSSHLLPIYTNPELAKFQPRELMVELKARGFRWEYMLEPQRKIMFDKLK
jgi:hypothetical protein